MEAGVNLGSEVRKAVEGAAMPRRKRGSARVHAALGAGIVLMIACVSVAIFYLRSEAIAGWCTVQVQPFGGNGGSTGFHR